MKHAILASLIAVWAVSAAAHSPLEMTVPAHEATLAEAPSEIVLEFKGKIRLTRVKLKHQDASEADLDLEGFSGFISDYTIPMQSMGHGKYVIEWRGLGDDGHPLNGKFSFTVEQ